jgi:uncharacterized protein (TIGR02271 family)
MTARKIVAVFDTSTAAQTARTRLIETGIPGEQITITDQNSLDERRVETPHARGSFWAHIKEMFMPDHDRHTYEESMRRGGYMLVATVDDNTADEAIACLESAGAIDLDEREARWRAEGWQSAAGRQVASDGGTTETQLNETADDIAPGPGAMNPDPVRTSGEPRKPTRAAGSAKLDEGTTSESIPVIEERLRVGKREINRGSVRVRSYIVEEPVHEEVRLREEHVNVERRPVNEPVRPVVKGSPEDILQERTLEVTETAEQAVVGKEARVTEQVVVGKSTDERVESIDDTVRRTKVEIEDDREQVGPGPTSGTPSRDAPSRRP